MEDPARDVEGLLHTLLDNPTLRRQEETLRRYFTEDVELYHFYVNSRGLSTLIALYHMAQLLGNYSGVMIHGVVYDEVKNTVAIRLTVFVRPLLSLFQRTPLQLSVWLELEDVVVNDKVVKKVKVQRDYFERSPIMQQIPIIGKIYNSYPLRIILGNAQAGLFHVLQALIVWILPKTWHGWSGLYSHDIASKDQ